MWTAQITLALIHSFILLIIVLLNLFKIISSPLSIYMWITKITTVIRLYHSHREIKRTRHTHTANMWFPFFNMMPNKREYILKSLSHVFFFPFFAILWFDRYLHHFSFYSIIVYINTDYSLNNHCSNIFWMNPNLVVLLLE